MSPRYRVRNLVCESGERLPLLLDGPTGAPLFEPTLFVLTELRALNRASATLAQATRVVMVGKLVLDHLGVDLDARFAEGRMLELGQIEALCKLSALSQESLDGLPPHRDETSPLPAKVASLERVRMRSKGHAALPTVNAENRRSSRYEAPWHPTRRTIPGLKRTCPRRKFLAHDQLRSEARC